MHPTLKRFKQRKPQTIDAFADWVNEERKIGLDRQGQAQTNNDRGSDDLSVQVGECSCPPLSSACLAANGALSLSNLACHLLDRQVERLAADFEKEGGFTERFYLVRAAKRKERGR